MRNLMKTFQAPCASYALYGTLSCPANTCLPMMAVTPPGAVSLFYDKRCKE